MYKSCPNSLLSYYHAQGDSTSSKTSLNYGVMVDEIMKNYYSSFSRLVVYLKILAILCFNKANI